MKKATLQLLLTRIAFTLLIPLSSFAEDRLRLATTTSTDNSGLLAVLHAPFESAAGIKVDVIAVGTGKALRLAQNGDVDLVMVHAPSAEKKFIEDGFGKRRLPIMHNDFVLLGPANDPAQLASADNLADAIGRIAAVGHPFISRGDDSGTHKKELSIWDSADIDPQGNWYIAAGQGMGAVIKMADDKLAYTLSDRGTWLSFKNKADLWICFEGDPSLHNPYHVILLNDSRHPHIRSNLARRYVDFIRGPEGQRIIGDYRVNGLQLFHPDVIK